MFTIYRQVASIIDKVLKHKGSVKSLALGDSSIVSKSLTFALCCQVLKYHKVIDTILQKSNFSYYIKNEKRKRQLVDKSMVMVAVYETLFGQASQDTQLLKNMFESFLKLHHPLFPLIKTKYYSVWNQTLVQLKIDNNEKVKNNEDLLRLSQFSTEYHDDTQSQNNNSNNSQKQEFINRFLRVNTLKSNEKSVIDELKRLGFEHDDNGDDETTSMVNKNDESANVLDRNSKKHVIKDEHIPELLLLYPITTATHELSIVQKGQVIVQDKASCMPVHVLMQTLNKLNLISSSANNKKKFDFIDACAAPGNKTSFLAARVALDANRKNMKVFAFDRDVKRVEILKNRLKAAGGLENDLVQPIHKDFLTVDPNDEKFKNVRAIMLDPSCSGSGIVGRGVNDESQQRLDKLHNFQCTLLKHAFSFPNVECVVYSTCSIHETENEKTVFNVLNNQPLPQKNDNSELFGLYKCFPEWTSRGTCNDKRLGKYYSMERIAPYVIRCYPKEHLTNGFFVSCFVRNRHLSEEEKVEKFINTEIVEPESAPAKKVIGPQKRKGLIITKKNNKRKKVK